MLELLIHQILAGLFRASYYWLIASGLTLIFGVTRVINFAHAAFFVLGGYIALTIDSLTGNFWIAVAVATLTIGCIGAAVEMGLIKPLYKIENLYQLLITFAVTLIVNDASKLIWGAASRSMKLPTELAISVKLAGRSYPLFYFFVITIAIIVFIALYIALEKTLWGLKVKSTWRDVTMAQALRINTGRVYTTTFFIGSLLAGFGGACMVAFTPVAPGLGDSLIVTAFVIVVLAGLGNLFGAYVSSIIIGIAESMFLLFIPELDILLIFVIMAAVLLVRPWGLFGER
jgi:branched-subunit amino acid ABC-type transport system permease component